MALPEFTKKLIEKKLEDYCSNKVSVHARSQLRIAYKIRGNSITLFEERPVYTNPSEWISIVVAQFRFDPKTQKWRLYCADRNSRWHKYLGSTATKNFDRLLAEVDDDPTGIFWG